MATNDGNISATALKALSGLDFFGDHKRPLSVQEVAQGIGADRATTYRMLMTLIQSGYLTRDATSRSYRLSLKVLSLARHVVSDDERAAQILSCLRQISDESGETVHYSALEGDQVVLVFRAKGTQRVSVDFQIGDRSALHCTSIGKVLLAYADPRLVETVVAKGLEKMGPKTITDPDVLRRELTQIRAQRYALDDLEFAADMRCLALPVFENGGFVPGGVAISGPASRMTIAQLQTLRKIAVPHVIELSRKLGGAVE